MRHANATSVHTRSDSQSAVVQAIHHADCLDVMRQLSAESVDLCYLDPPFNTGQRQKTREHSYGDSWPSLDTYLSFMRARIEQIHRLLKPTGSILLHCDWRTCHHFRIMLDDVFGSDNFVNHIIWAYGLGGSSPRRFARKHDDILFYGRSSDYKFTPPMINSTSRRMAGRPKKATDVLDIPAINNMAAERTGYPTQKPEALLELLLCACSPDGGLILDPFCGSGTTPVVAAQLNRRWIGIDTNPEAVATARQRLDTLASRARSADG